MRLYYRLYFILLFFLCYGTQAIAQDSTVYNKKGSSAKVKRAADNLKESLAGNDEGKTAKRYEVLSKELIEKGEYAKAETYMKKALEIYSHLNNKK